MIPNELSTVKEITAYLDELGIKYPKRAKKAVIVGILNEVILNMREEEQHVTEKQMLPANPKHDYMMSLLLGNEKFLQNLDGYLFLNSSIEELSSNSNSSNIVLEDTEMIDIEVVSESDTTVPVEEILFVDEEENIEMQDIENNLDDTSENREKHQSSVNNVVEEEKSTTDLSVPFAETDVEDQVVQIVTPISNSKKSSNAMIEFFQNLSTFEIIGGILIVIALLIFIFNYLL